ncbi:MAG TPA: hypothetical protein VIF57_20240 [Polyangia bacterium]
MTRWARIRIRDGRRSPPARADAPALGVDPTDVFGTPIRERERITREAADAAALVANATPAQIQLLRRLAASATAAASCRRASRSRW